MLNQNEVLHQLDLIHLENVQLKNENNYLSKRIEGLIEDNRHLMQKEGEASWKQEWRHLEEQLDRKQKELKGEKEHSYSLQSIIDKLKGQVRSLEGELKDAKKSYEQLTYEYQQVKQEKSTRAVVKLPTRELEEVKRQLEDLNRRYKELYEEYQGYKRQQPQKEVVIQREDNSEQIRQLQEQLEASLRENRQLKSRQPARSKDAWCC